MYKQLSSKLLKHKNLAVFSHVRPDGDCLGSQIALALWLQKNGVNCTAFNEDPINDNLKWLTEYLSIEKPNIDKLNEFDGFVFVDGNALHRFGPAAIETAKLGVPLYMIDHHPNPDDIFDDFISITEASSTCELVYNLINNHDIQQMDSKIAKALYTGIVTDTGSFQFDSVKPATLEAASNLLKIGQFSPPEIVEPIYSSKKINQIKLLGLSLETLSLHANQQIATMYVTKEMFDKTNTTHSDTEGFVSYPLSILGVKACAFLREENKNVRISFRSRSELNANLWASEFNGGGHLKASGGDYDGNINDAIKEVVSVGKKQL